jgi:hypothetical protein
MLTSTKNGAPEKDRTASVAAEAVGRAVQHDQWARSEPTTKAGMASCIGSDMSIVGKLSALATAYALHYFRKLSRGFLAVLLLCSLVVLGGRC